MCVWRFSKAVKSYKMEEAKYGGVCEFLGVRGAWNEAERRGTLCHREGNVFKAFFLFCFCMCFVHENNILEWVR